MRCALSILFLWVSLANAATYYVRTDGSDSNTGTANTAGGAWLTIGKAETMMVAGDTVRVADGVYDERVTITGTSGTVGNLIRYLGNPTGTGVVMRGFQVTDVQNIWLRGFEPTHANTSFRGGVHMTGTSTSNIMIQNFYIHDVNREGIHGGNATHVTIRDSVIYYIAHPGSIQDPDVAIAADSGATKWIVENVRIKRSSDYIDLYGPTHTFRNLWMDDCDLTYWNDIGTHPDFFQAGSDGAQTFMRHQIIQSVLMGNNPSPDGHGIIQQDNSGFGDTNMLIRGNVFYGIGGGGAGGFGTEFVQHYNNTFFANLTAAAPPIGNLINWYRDSPDGSMGGLLINTLVAHVGSGHDDIYLDIDNDVWMGNNWGFAANSEASYAGTTNPLFVDTNALDFRLQSGSPVRGQGRHITAISSASGSGTSFVVTNTHRISDGRGRVEGDIISFIDGSNVRVTGVDYETHTITVASTITWTQNQLIFWGPLGYQKDIGAYPYGAVFLSACTFSVNAGTATVTPTGDALKVRQYRDGIDIAEDYDAPYTFSHQSGDVYRAFPFYAQQLLAVNATEVSAGPFYPSRATTTPVRSLRGMR